MAHCAIYMFLKNRSLVTNAPLPMRDSSLVVPNPITFEQAIAITQTLLAKMEVAETGMPEQADVLSADVLSAETIQSTIANLVSSENGARGFFVTYLMDDRTLADHPSAAVVQALQSSPDNVAELLVKNLAMSTAMAIAHRRHQNEAMAQGSDRVQRRTTKLIQQVQLPEVAQKTRQLQQSIATGAGEYQGFLDRWGYDDEQRQHIAVVLQTLV